MRVEELPGLLLLAIPEIDAAGRRREWEDAVECGAHVVFGDFLNPLLLSLLTTDADALNNRTILERAFSFLEVLANSENRSVRDVVKVTVCERLGDDRDILRRARAYMGLKTMSLSHEVEREWKRE